MADGTSELAAAALFNVNGLVALVTGGGSGIGLMYTRALALNGAAKVYIAGRRLDVLEQAAESIGPNVVPIQCDVTNKDSISHAAGLVQQDAGFLNLLICNSGDTGPRSKGPTPEMSLDEFADHAFGQSWDHYNQTFAVNSAGVFFTAAGFLKLLGQGNEKGNVEQTSQIIVTASGAAFTKFTPGGYAYGQSKAAAVHATKQLAVTLPQWNIRANAIAPGLFPSDMLAALGPPYYVDGKPARLPKSIIPFERMGDEKDMAGIILSLASRAGAYINGQVVTIDGGRLGLYPTTQ